MKKISHRILFGLLLGSLSLNSGIISNAHADEDSRMQHKFGIYTGFLNDPFPTLIGINAAYNLASFLRINVGYGSISTPGLTFTTIGGGAKFMIPGTSFTPVLGINYSSINATVLDSTAGVALYGISGSANQTYVNAGFDWQAHVGFNLGFGYNYSLLQGVGGAPYFNIGWFF